MLVNGAIIVYQSSLVMVCLLVSLEVKAVIIDQFVPCVVHVHVCISDFLENYQLSLFVKIL
uniref:Uncharacterized protein n=1 Tax=Amphimedon queenslandica TaxID=400682 RepID=A0A1X7U953_AMPQE